MKELVSDQPGHVDQAESQRGESLGVASRVVAQAPTRSQSMVDASPRLAQFQARAERILSSPRVATQRQAIANVAGPGNQGLPLSLKAGVEAMSGLSMDHVKVHRDSPKPAQLNAHAYAQGQDIYLGPGQEKHLPHEAWHVVQQAQGRVKPTAQMYGGVRVNDDPSLEREADAHGAKAARGSEPIQTAPATSTSAPVVQGYFTQPISYFSQPLSPEEPGKRKALALEVYVAERRLRAARVRTLDFRELADSDKDEGDLETYVEAAIAERAPTSVLVLPEEEGGQYEAMVPDALIAAYRHDLAHEDAHYLQEPEGEIIANDLGVTAHVMNQVHGILIQANGTDYGSGDNEGYLLHVNGNHYIVIHLYEGDEPDYIDMLGNGYQEGEKTVIDGNCLIDGLHLIRHNEHAESGEVARLRGLAARPELLGGVEDDFIRAILSEMITAMANGQAPNGIGSMTQRYLERDPELMAAYRLAQEEEDDAFPEWEDEDAFHKGASSSESASSSSSDSDGEGRARKISHRKEGTAPRFVSSDRDQPSGLEQEPSDDMADSDEHALEADVTRYVLECNRIGEKAASQTALAKRVKGAWRARFKAEAPDHAALAKWIEKRERETHDYFGSDTDSSEDESYPDVDEASTRAAPFSKEDNRLLAKLNLAISNAKSAKDIEAILSDKAYSRFLVPQFRGIAYMTNRFSKNKRREHRRGSQLGKPVFADAVRPDDMPREDFYTEKHGRDSAVWENTRVLKRWLREKRKPDPFIDKSRKVMGKSRIFPTPFHLLQSDYSQNYTKSSATLAEYYAQENSSVKGKEPDSAPEKDIAPPVSTGRRKAKRPRRATAAPKSAKNPARDKAYAGLPFRSHPFVSTADSPRHAVRYALGNKPIAAEKAYRLRPRWRSKGKPQHPYSGKVYASLHPLRDYLAPDAPSHVWSGRKLGALSIDNDTSKEGESSFLGAIKRNRVALEQVIRWPSLVAEKDDDASFGLSREEREAYRRTLEKHKPHSKPQQDLKSKKLGPKVEAYFTRRIEALTQAEAERRKKKLIYRGLDGNFQSTPPSYVTPTKTSSSKWKEPARSDTTDEVFKRITQGEQPIGGLTEGYFGDWPKESFYEQLSDEEAGSDDGYLDYRDEDIDDYGQEPHGEDSVIAAIRRTCQRATDEAEDLLDTISLGIGTTMALEQACMLALKLARRAVSKLERELVDVGHGILDGLYVPPSGLGARDAGAQQAWFDEQTSALLDRLDQIIDAVLQTALQQIEDEDVDGPVSMNESDP